MPYQMPPDPPKPDDNNPPTPEPAPRNDPTPPAEPPQWAADLSREIRELPGKLRASITDDDKSSIAEHVHGLFERSGAFVTPGDDPADDPDKPKEPDPDNPEPTPDPSRETPPRKQGRLAGFARWFEGGN